MIYCPGIDNQVDFHKSINNLKEKIKMKEEKILDEGETLKPGDQVVVEAPVGETTPDERVFNGFNQKQYQFIRIFAK